MCSLIDISVLGNLLPITSVFHPDNGDSMFFRNVDTTPHCHIAEDCNLDANFWSTTKIFSAYYGTQMFSIIFANTIYIYLDLLKLTGGITVSTQFFDSICCPIWWLFSPSWNIYCFISTKPVEHCGVIVLYCILLCVL
jgi:hypothetical protein